MTQAAVKAGLVGGGVAVVMVFVGLIPCLNCIAPLLMLPLYVGVGVLAAYWLPPIRTVGEGAGAGAIAGLLSALIGGVVDAVVSMVNFAITGGSQALMSQIPPDTLRQFREAGVDPSLFTSAGSVLAVSSLCCIVGLILAAILGAIGGAIYAAAKSD